MTTAGAGAPTTSTLPAPDNASDILQSYFERSVALVHHVFLRLEDTYLAPAIGYLSRSFHTRPILSAFLTVFLSLSFLPTLSFIGFSLWTFGTLTFIALAGSFLTTTVIVLSAGCILLSILAMLFVISCIITSFALALFLTARLFLLVRSDGPRAGVSEWTHETKVRLYRGHATDPQGSKAEGECFKDDDDDDDDDRHSNASVGSTVVVLGTTDGGASGKDSALLVKQETE